MKKLVLVACAVAGFVGSSFAGTALVWNPIMRRWEYQDTDTGAVQGSWNKNLSGQDELQNGQGQTVGHWQWNQITQRWEFVKGY